MKPSTVALAVAVLAAPPAFSQQLMAWPAQAASALWRGFLPGQPLPRPLPTPPDRRPIPRPIPGPRPNPTLPPEAEPVQLSGYRIEGTVTDQAADLTYRITFHNPTDRRLEGVLMVPIPADTTLTGFSMTVAGQDTKGELLDAAQAASIYESIVRRAQDPGLLELVGECMFRARVFPIEPRANIVATLRLTQTLPQNGGLVSMRLPMRSAQMSGSTRDKASARVEIRTTRPMRSAFSPTAGAKLERRGEREAVLSYQEGSEGPQDVALLFSMVQDPLAAGVLSYRESGEDGTFLLTLAPRIEREANAAPKDVVFVVDRSGSMGGEKMEQARKALLYCVSRLNPQDRFGIVDFGTDFNQLEDRLIAADEDGKARGRRYIERLEPSGGTNIEAGLTEGLRLLRRDEGRVPMLFFLTDGIPTAGLTDVGALLRKAAEMNGINARLFSFGVGSDVNSLLLDKLADQARGARDYVAPGEDIEDKVSSLYQKVSRPALTDVRVEWKNLDAVEVYPRPIPDLFHGGELALYGRYKDHGKGTLIVTGKAGGKDMRFEYPVEFPKADSRNAFLPRLWAGRKVAHELDAIRLSGRPASQEQIDSIVKLAKKHGIVTPYTSYLVIEEGMNMDVLRREARQQFQAMSADAAGSGFSGGAATAARARRDSFSIAAMRGSAPAAAPAMMSEPAEAAMKRAVAQEMEAKGRRMVATRTVGGKTFYRRGESWVDGDAEGDEAKAAKTVTLKARGDAWFELAAKDAGLARCLALGDSLKLLWKGVLYVVEP